MATSASSYEGGGCSPAQQAGAVADPPAVPAHRARVAALLADPRRMLCAVAALVAVVPCLDVLGDPDLWWHLRAGRVLLDTRSLPRTELFSYTAVGHPWTAHEWLSEVLFALLAAAGGILLVALLMAAVAWSGLLACALRARARAAGPVTIAVALVLGAKAAQPVLGTRPQVITFALTCWALLLAERALLRGGRLQWALPPLFLLWANLHAGFAEGLAVLALLLGAEAAKRWLGHEGAAAPARIRALATAVAVSAAAACLNPSGPLLYRFVLTTSSGESSKPIAEWQSPNFHDAGMLPLLLLLCSVPLLMAVAPRRLDLRDAVLGAAGVALALTAVRNTALCVALLLPAWAALAHGAAGAVAARWAQTRARHEARRVGETQRAGGPAVAMGLLLAIVGLVVVAAGVARTASDASAAQVAAHYPARAADVLTAQPGTVRVFAPYGVSGYLIDRLYPKARVYDYGESIALGDAVLTDYLRIASGAGDSPSALHLLDCSGTTAVLAEGALQEELAVSPAWRRSVQDGGLTLFLRNGAVPTISC